MARPGQERRRVEIVRDNEDTDLMTTKGEMLADTVNAAVDIGTAPLAAAVAMQASLPMWARVAAGVVALAKAPVTLRRVRRWWKKDADE